MILSLFNVDRSEDNAVLFFNLAFVQKERKLLANKRLDLDAAKTKLKKARMADARAVVSDDDAREVVKPFSHACNLCHVLLMSQATRPKLLLCDSQREVSRDVPKIAAFFCLCLF